MTQERKQSARLWFWRGSAVLLIVVFFAVRSLTRDRLQVRVAAAAHMPLVSTISTNGRVEPEVNYEIHSPIATTVKAVYVQPGDQVAAGKLLMVLDDVQARAREAAAESGVKAAQAALEAATHNGTQQERQMAAADETRARLERDEAQPQPGCADQAQRDRGGVAERGGRGAAAAGRRRRPIFMPWSRARTTAIRRQRWSARGRRWPTRKPAWRRRGRWWRKPRCTLRRRERSIASMRGRTEFVEEGKLLLQLADLHHERVRAYFDEPEIGRLAVGQKIQIKWDAKPGRIWNGHIERTPVTVINLGTRSVGEVLVKIDDADGELLPDTNVTVTVTISSEPNALSCAARGAALGERQDLRLQSGE